MPIEQIVPSIIATTRTPLAPSRLQDESLIPYRRLALQLHHDLRRGLASRSVLVVSPDDARICAVVSANLACCMAEEMGRAVLLGDATREGLLSSEMTNSAPKGLNNFLSNPALPMDSLALPTSFNDVFFLPSGTRSAGYSPENTTELLRSSSALFDFVIMAAGAVLKDPFALAGAPEFGAVLMLLVENETPMKKYLEVEQTLKMCKVGNVRIVMINKLKRPVEGRSK